MRSRPRESRSLSGEREEQIRAARRLALRLPDRKEDAALSFGDMTGCRHADVGLLDLIEGGALGGHDLRRRNAAIEARLPAVASATGGFRED